MSITKLYAGVVGDPLNTSGQVLAASINQLIDAHVPHLKALPTAANAQTDTVYNVIGFYAGSTIGGGAFVFSETHSKSMHNGGTILAPEALAAWDGTRVNLSELYNWSGSGTGCYVRVGAEYHIYEFGGGDGVNNDSQILQSLLNATPAGACASIEGARCVVDDNFTVTDLRTLAGGWTNPDLIGSANAQQYANARSAIILNSTATITIGQSASVKNVLVYRKGMTFPVSDDSLYAGTAFVSSSGTCSLSEMLVMGFNKLFVGTNQRFVIDRVFGDNRNGIEISGSPDVCYLSRCHMWPFAADTIIYPNSAANRGGVAYYLHDVADWVKLDSCFSYAYKIGYDFNNVSSITAVSCSADHNFPNSQVGGSKGFVIRGDCKDTMLQNLQAAAQTVGVEIDVTDADRNVTIMGGALWSNTTNSIIVKNGSAKIGGGVLIRDSVQALGVASASSRVEIDDAIIRNIAAPYVIPNTTSSVYIGENIRYEGIANGSLNTNNLKVPSIASVGNILLPATGNIFTVTGTNAINFITGYHTRKEITLIFEDTLTVISGGVGVAGLRLSGNANFVTQQGSTLTLRHNGDKWFEVARSAYNSVSTESIKSLPTTAVDGQQYNVMGFYAGSTTGGGAFVWRASQSKSTHNGVTVYAPEAIAAWNGTQAGIATLLSWTGSGSGVFVRSGVETVTFEMAGAILDANPSTGTGTDNTLSVNKAFSVGLPVFFSKGFCKVKDALQMVTGQKMVGSGRTTSMFVVSSDFNLSAPHVLRLGTSEPAAEIYDVGFSLWQPDQPVRAACVKYPWVISAKNLPRFSLDNIRIEGAWDGVDATGNAGGAIVGTMEIGALNTGFHVDGSLDFFHVNTLHFWPFGFTTKPALLDNVYYDGIGTSLKFGMCDGADFGTVSMFRTKMEITVAATSGISNSFNRIQLDGDGARLIIGGGLSSISQLYSTKSSISTLPSIECNEGLTTIDDVQILGDSTGADIVVAGGTLNIDGGTVLWNNLGSPKLKVTSGQCSFKGAKIRNYPTFAYTQPFAEQSGTGELIFCENVFDLKSTGSGVAVRYLADNLGNYCMSNRFSGYTFSAPVNSALGIYQGPVRFIPIIKGTTSAGAASYSVQEGFFEQINDNLVMYSITLTYTGHTGTGGTLVSIPHTLSDFGQRVPQAVYSTDFSFGSGRQLAAFAGLSGSGITIMALDPSGGSTVNFFDAAGSISLSGFYRRS